MEHSLPQVASPWRTATLVASAVAVDRALVLVVIGVALLAEPVSNQVRQAAEAKVYAPAKPKPVAAPAVGKPKLSRAETSVIVLNGSGRSGAAAERRARSGHRLHDRHASATPRAATSPARSSCSVPATAPRPTRLAADLKLKIVGPLDGLRGSDLLGAHLALIVGS